MNFIIFIQVLINRLLWDRVSAVNATDPSIAFIDRLITRWHGSARVFYDDNASQWKSGKFGPRSLRNP